jgi:hypothetical protein
MDAVDITAILFLVIIFAFGYAIGRASQGNYIRACKLALKSVNRIAMQKIRIGNPDDAATKLAWEFWLETWWLYPNENPRIGV